MSGVDRQKHSEDNNSFRSTFVLAKGSLLDKGKANWVM